MKTGNGEKYTDIVSTINLFLKLLYDGFSSVAMWVRETDAQLMWEVLIIYQETGIAGILLITGKL